MKNRVRVTSDENVVTNAKIELLGPDDEYVDVSRCVTGLTIDLRVGEPSTAHIDTVTVGTQAEAQRIDEESQMALAYVLRSCGWSATMPDGTKLHRFRRR